MPNAVGNLSSPSISLRSASHGGDESYSDATDTRGRHHADIRKGQCRGSGGLFHFALIGTALLLGASVLAFEASAQDVVMRRPLPSLGTSAAPTPTPTALPQAGDPSAHYGWMLDCSIPRLACMKGSTQRSETTIREVDAAFCPLTQDREKNDFASEHGWTPIRVGIDASTGTSTCIGPASDSGPWPRTVHMAAGFCDADVLAVQCLATTYASAADLSAGDAIVRVADMDLCRSQDVNDSVYRSESGRLNAYEPNSVIAPGEIDTKQGSSCAATMNEERYAYGAMCEMDQPKCMEISYMLITDSVGKTYEVTNIGNAYDAEACAMAEQTADDILMVRRNGMMSPGSNPCGPIDVYAAEGACRTTTTYDAGWPHSGGAHITTGFDMRCYAVRGVGTDEMTTTLVGNASCDTQRPTILQRDQLATLAPALVDPAVLDRDCPPSGGVGLNYQRDTKYATGPEDFRDRTYATLLDYWAPRAPSTSNDVILVESTYTYPFVCTDLAPGGGRRPPYFDPATPAVRKSVYPITRQPCDAQLLADMQSIAAGTSPDLASSNQMRQNCRQTLGVHANPTRIAQCGSSVTTDGKGTMTYKARMWYPADDL